MFHAFTQDLSHIELPGAFTYPFHYTAHPLCIVAAEEVQTYITRQSQWLEELNGGKMFGVLIVQSTQGELGFLAAFSGNLAGRSRHSYFVPPVYDLSDPNGFFRVEEKKISAINHRISTLLEDPLYQKLSKRLTEETAKSILELREARAELKKLKEVRAQRRKQELTTEELAALIRESQHQNAEFKRLEQHWKEHLCMRQQEVSHFSRQVETLKNTRKTRSAALQEKLFSAFQVLNARKEPRSITSLFTETVHKTPPAGAGECAAPKLLQYAYQHHLTPIALAEFWWGESPQAELRRHGQYYPACTGKCKPILQHMLEGLTVERNPLQEDLHRHTLLKVIFEDEYLAVVYKPEGMLTVPGKGNLSSVYQHFKNQYPTATGPLIVHRLDMATSGLLVVTKNKEVHQHIQAQFKHRTLKKRYMALLDGIPAQNEGVIELPLCPDPLDRPRQIVSQAQGKPTLTRYRVHSHTATQARIAFEPLTGRTHQLRVHAAHPLGLNCPIHGDALYGQPADRLCLHAEYLEFTHPISGARLRFEHKADF